MDSIEQEDEATTLKYVEWKRKNIQIIEPTQGYTIFQHMLRPILDQHGSLSGKRILDVACGEGCYTRRLKKLNCDYILGVDMSPTLIKCARDLENAEPLNIDYVTADIQELASLGQPFNVITAFYLLNYMATREEFLQTVRVIYEKLGKDEHMLGATINVLSAKQIINTDKYRKYGVAFYTDAFREDELLPEGKEIILTLYDENNKEVTSYTNYYWSPHMHEDIFKKAGFKTFEWVPFKCDPTITHNPFYKEYINCPYSIGLLAIK